jgi:hypothetical protein
MKLKVSVAIESELVERLDKIAAITHESRSQVMERMVRDQIMSAEQFANLMANPQARAELIKQFANPEVLGPILRAMGEKQPPKKMRQRMVESVERIGEAVEEIKKGKGRKS